jgi:hypothetical protein
MGVNEDTYPVVPKTVPKCVGFGTDVNAGTVCGASGNPGMTGV